MHLDLWAPNQSHILQQGAHDPFPLSIGPMRLGPKPLEIVGESQHSFSLSISNDSPIRCYRGKPKA
jgi:hypothetical protein